MRYERNELTRDFNAGVEETWNAALKALQALGYPDPEEKALGTLEGKITCEKVHVRIERQPEVGTRAYVRVGNFATKEHQRKALLILEETARVLDEEAELREWSRKVQALSESQ